jgi:hypothetical protein
MDQYEILLVTLFFHLQSAGSHSAVTSRRITGYTSDHRGIYTEVVNTGTQVPAGYKRERNALETTGGSYLAL